MQATQSIHDPSKPTQKRNRRSQGGLAVLMIAPAVIVLMIMGLYPLLFAVNVSLRNYMLTRPNELGQWAGLANFQTVFSDPLFWESLGRTGVFFLVTVPLQILVGIGVALLLNTTRWQGIAALLRVALVIPFAMTPAVVGLLGRLIYDREFGIINYALGQINIAPINWFGDPTWALLANALTDIWQWTPFVALVMLSGLTLVPQDSIDAMKLESNSGWSLFRFLQLPFLLPGLTAVLIIRTADILKLFDMPFILTRGGPGVSTEFISLYIQRVGFRVFDMGVASAQALLLLVLAIVLSRLYIRFFYREVSEA
jgi:multiple sugar transport system permease protein